ncbi:MAG: helix-turn-helix transcriptional regulator [Bacteroidetes bacterium]|nr:helix-turn-helix transcriptional regulator [Bacteroidota bacterium]
MGKGLSKYYKLPALGGLEALGATRHRTSFPHHYHDTFNVSLIYEGVFSAKLDDRLITAPTGGIFVTNPLEVHANPCDKKGSVSFFTFYLSQDFVRYCNGGRPVVFNSKVIYDTDLFASLHQLSLLVDAGLAGSCEEVFRRGFSDLVVRHGSQRPADDGARAGRLFAEFLAEENLARFSLQEAADRFGMDKYKFLRLFKDQTGLTPNNYFILKRIERSKSLLAHCDDLLSVAIDLGFYDSAHFSNHFKKFTGVSPGVYIQSV